MKVTIKKSPFRVRNAHHQLSLDARGPLNAPLCTVPAPSLSNLAAVQGPLRKYRNFSLIHSREAMKKTRVTVELSRESIILSLAGHVCQRTYPRASVAQGDDTAISCAPIAVRLTGNFATIYCSYSRLRSRFLGERAVIALVRRATPIECVSDRL